MFSKLIMKNFIKDYTHTEKASVREAFGTISGIVGIILNILLFGIKLAVGIVANSISVTADAFNNLTDAASSIITIASFKISSKPADEEHPFGHGRIEYIAAFIVSFMVMLVGFEFTKSSFDRIIHPVAVSFQLIPFLLMLFSIAVKMWLSKFNNFMGKAIDSKTLIASSMDALSDVVVTSTIAISFVIDKFVTFQIDGYIGILVALFILYNGFSMVKDPLDPLLGEAPNPKLIDDITNEILSYEYITGIHDLIIHSYGPGRTMASLHAEVPSNISILKIHEIIDQAEKELSKKFNIFLVIHMDPINTDSKEIARIRVEVETLLKEFPIVQSMHDFRIVGDGEIKNLIFDIVISFKNNINHDEEEKLKQSIDKRIKELHPRYNTVITLDRDYTMK